MILQNVEIYNASQVDTMKAALRFENAANSWSSVVNCSIHNGLGWGVNIKASANIHFENNIVYSFKPIGLSLSKATNVTIKKNFVGHIYERKIDAGVHNLDKRGVYAICSYFEDQCKDTNVFENIAAGGAYAGFVSRGHDCGEYSNSIFSNNVAHSIAGEKGGVGMIIHSD